MTVSGWTASPASGETRRKALLRQFGSLKRLRAASVEEIAAVPGIGRRTAEAILAAVAEPARPSRPPTARTGERVDRPRRTAGRPRYASGRRRRHRRGRLVAS